MPTAKVRWRKSEVSRLIQVARKVRVQVHVDIRPDGTLSAISPTQPQEKETRDAANYGSVMP